MINMIEENDLAIGVRSRLESMYVFRKAILWAIGLLALISLFCLGRWLEIDIPWLDRSKSVNLEELPLIKSSNNDFKIVPDDAGGLKIKNIDRGVYQDMVGSSGNYADTQASQKPLDAKIDEIIKQDIFGSSKNNTVPTTVKTPTTPVATNPTTVTTTAVTPQDTSSTTADATPALNKNLLNNIKDKSKQRKPTMISAQIAAFSTLDKTNSYKNYLLERFPEMFNGANNLYISRGEDSNGRSIYRLRLLNFPTRENAKAFCDRYLNATAKLGGNCLVLEE